MSLGMQKGRPPQLSLSPSDPALAANSKLAPVEHQRPMDEDRGVLSDVGYSLFLYRFCKAEWDPAERYQARCN